MCNKFFSLYPAEGHYLLATTSRVEGLKVPGQDVFVVFLLEGRELHTDDELGLGWHVLFIILIN